MSKYILFQCRKCADDPTNTFSGVFAQTVLCPKCNGEVTPQDVPMIALADWIPVSESLPKVNELCCAIYDGKMYTGFLRRENSMNAWFLTVVEPDLRVYIFCTLNVTHWLQIPKFEEE